MITRLHLKNFKCIRDAQVELGPFTVLIGPNDSGKTTLLDAISYLGQLVSPSNQGQLSSPANQARPALASLTWRKTVDLPIEWEVSGESVALEEQDDGLAREVRRTFHYSLALSPGSGLVLREQLVIDGQDLLDRTHPAPNQPIGRGVPEPLKVGNLSLALSPGQTALQELSVHNGPGVRGVVASIASTVKYRLDPEVMRKDAAASSHPVLGPVGEN